MWRHVSGGNYFLKRPWAPQAMDVPSQGVHGSWRAFANIIIDSFDASKSISNFCFYFFLSRPISNAIGPSFRLSNFGIWKAAGTPSSYLAFFFQVLTLGFLPFAWAYFLEGGLDHLNDLTQLGQNPPHTQFWRVDQQISILSFGKITKYF